MESNRAFSSSSSAICSSSDSSALCAIDLNMRLATSAAPIWSGQVFQKIIAMRMRLNSTAQTNSSRPGWSVFSTTHLRLDLVVTSSVASTKLRRVQKDKQWAELNCTSVQFICVSLYTPRLVYSTSSQVSTQTSDHAYTLMPCNQATQANSAWPSLRGQAQWVLATVVAVESEETACSMTQ